MASGAALPFVLVNVAMTADGKIATADRRISSFGSPRDLEHLYALRAGADAVLCGARTAQVPGVHLGPGPARFRQVRRRAGLAEFNLRIIASASAAMNPAATIFRGRRFSPIIILTAEDAPAVRRRRLAEVADAVAGFGHGTVDWPRALAWLRAQWGVRRLVCEGGGELNAALFRARLVRELHLTICPFVFGGHAAPTLADGAAPTRLAEAVPCRMKKRRRVGNEMFLVYEVC